MKKLISLIKVSLNHDMNIFKINSKKQSKLVKVGIPIILTIYIMIISGVYADKMMNLLKPLNLEFIALTLFALLISIITFFEGIYKSSSILFNCKDDNLLFSLPIKKTTILFIRILKLYIFEFLFNSLFILPAIIIYAIRINPTWTYYLSSIIALLLLPIIPIIASCIIGFIITFISNKFKGKNIIQTVITIILLIGILYISYNSEGFMNNIIKNATSINEIITKLYYPVGAYIELITDFNYKTLIFYTIINISLLIITIYILGKIYYKVNSNNKRVLVNHHKNYKIKSNSPSISFIKKEIQNFVTTPVYIINAGFGLVLYIFACIMITMRYGKIIDNIAKADPTMDISIITSFIPSLILVLIAFTSFMTSITSSMISLEGKNINILKSLPIKISKILLYKVLSAIIIMIPCIIVGNIILFIKFKVSIINIILLIIASILLPAISELIGIIVNLKYPKLDATNATEVVKQSMSSMISVMIGMGLSVITVVGIIKLIQIKINNTLIILLFNIIYLIIGLLLWNYLQKYSEKSFMNIET